MTYLRIIVAIAAVVAATAFSPAPLPKSHRKASVDDAILLQGTYKIVENGRPNVNNARVALIARRATTTKIRISGDKFSYLYPNGNDFVASTTYEMKLDKTTSPRAFDMTYTTNAYTMTMKGIYKIEGNKVTLLYVTTYSGQIQQDGERPTSFENPTINAMQMVLERE